MNPYERIKMLIIEGERRINRLMKSKKPDAGEALFRAMDKLDRSYDKRIAKHGSEDAFFAHSTKQEKRRRPAKGKIEFFDN